MLLMVEVGEQVWLLCCLSSELEEQEVQELAWEQRGLVGWKL